jgi:hypothetical protein
MNPLRWKREHQIAWLLTIAVGALIGFLWGIHEAPAHSRDAWGDTFTLSLSQIIEINLDSLYPKSAAGMLLTGAVFYVWKLART